MASHVFAIPLWFTISGLRSNEDPTKKVDTAIFVALQTIKACRYLQLPSHGLHTVALFTVGFLVSALAVLTVVALWRATAGRGKVQWQPVDCNKPLLLPCRTTHSRLFPKKHSFAYDYLQISVPVDFEGRDGCVSVGNCQPRGLFHVDAADYLARTSSATTLQGKLESYLASEGIARNDWSRAYLVTAPRFLGYSFNPVSFWYIYDDLAELKMMILEVNNTFDERRMYLLQAGNEHTSNGATRFSEHWPKDFHVSPFNSRKGSYSLSATDPFVRGSLQAPGVDNTIVLSSSKGHAKLTARLFSSEGPMQPDQVSYGELAIFMIRWCWLGFFTFPRILREAFQLFFMLKLHVWLRPEVVPTSSGRRATTSERCLESFFDQYLAQVAANNDSAICVEYSSGLNASKMFNADDSRPNEKHVLLIQVTSPEFYARMTHYDTILDALLTEGFAKEPKVRTVHVSSEQSLRALFRSEASSQTFDSEMEWIDRWRWVAIAKLRCPPSNLAYATATGKPRPQWGKQSTLDYFVAQSCTDSWKYQRLVFRQFLGERLAFGFPEVLDGLDFVIRCVLASDAVISAPLTRPSFVHLWALLKGGAMDHSAANW